MKIIHLSNTDSGGAIELHAAMLKAGIDSSMLVKGYDMGTVPQVNKIGIFHRYRSNLGSYLSKYILPAANPKLTMFSIPLVGAALHTLAAVKEADVIYLHFVAQSSFLALSDIECLLKLGKPVVFITRDMWPATGGCHYFLDCGGYLKDCNDCPYYANEKKGFNWPTWQLKKKKSIYEKYTNLLFIGISEWNREVLSQSSASCKRDAYAIGNAIDTDTFTLLDRSEAKKQLGLPTGIPTIGFGARSTKNTLKGFDYLLKALDILQKRNISDFAIATFGTGKIESSWHNHYHVGYISDRNKLAVYYNAIDLYVSPTLAEAFGNTVAEAMACGTPVVGFDTGGLRDIIDHGINGYLAKFKDENDLATGIETMLQRLSDPVQPLQQLCRTKAVNNFSHEAVVTKHLEVLKAYFSL